MKLPTRSTSHIRETQSRDLLRNALPKSWLVRDITERDYGVDLYLEIVGANQRLSGAMVALQVKGATSIDFNVAGWATFRGFKRSTLNYLLALPVPAFVVAVCCRTGRCFWIDLKEKDRLGLLAGTSTTLSLAFREEDDISPSGVERFEWSQAMERRWLEIENAIEKSVMLFNTLGPLVLMGQRGDGAASCSTTYQYLLNQHYEQYELLCRFILRKPPVPLQHWYDENSKRTRGSRQVSPTLRYSVLKAMFSEILNDYRDCLIAAYDLVTRSQTKYFSRKRPWLVAHLAARPHTFVMDDWYPRFYFDEYETETRKPELLYFEDVSTFDSILAEIDPS